MEARTVEEVRICETCGRKWKMTGKETICLFCNNKRKLKQKLIKQKKGSFTATGTARFVSSQQFQRDILSLVGKIPADTRAIIGVARSGLSAATMLSMYLHLPLLAVRQNLRDLIEVGNGWRLGGQTHIKPSDGRVVVVDDTVMTGNSFRAIMPVVRKRFPEAMTASVYVNPLATYKPDIFASELGWPHLLEWNLFNSVLSPNMACDFDGILCRDCAPGDDDDGPRYMNFIQNAQPLYLPRKNVVPLIVTARIEKYREPTIQWLRKHGIRFVKLQMHPAKTLAERQKDNIAAYKAGHYSRWAKKHIPRPSPNLFVESDDNQARSIAKITGKLVVCPGSGRAYQ